MNNHFNTPVDLRLPSPLQPILWPNTNEDLGKLILKNKINIFCKRDDLIHPIISGNKSRKLSKSVDYIEKQGIKHVISFGGGHSNHLHALAYICYTLNIKFTAVVRGDYSQNPTSTLLDLKTWGATLYFVSKIDYRKREQSSYCNALLKQHAADLLIPEGGSMTDCFAGVGEIAHEYLAQQTILKTHITHIVLPVASGGTMAGLIAFFTRYRQLHPNQTLPKIVGIAMLKGEHYLEDLVNNLLKEAQAEQNNQHSPFDNWEIMHDFHQGGYAKTPQALMRFVDQFNQHKTTVIDEPVKLEPVYSGKCFFAVQALLKANYFAPSSQVMIIHTGGLRSAASDKP